MNFFNILDIVVTAKTDPGSKMIDRVQYFGCLIQINKSHKHLFTHFSEDPIVNIYSNFHADICM